MMLFICYLKSNKTQHNGSLVFARQRLRKAAAKKGQKSLFTHSLLSILRLFNNIPLRLPFL